YIAKDNQAKLTAITTGEGKEGRVIVTSGLKPGDELITSGNRVLYDGAEIVSDVVAGKNNKSNANG
ncbi:MAG: hypothetical protein IJP97_01410, partial [Synergistaceae bacterium]|nr:hypothetical protein [Synergistaceae bacterium]